MSELSALFSPIKIGSMELENRIVMKLRLPVISLTTVSALQVAWR
jgi:hypothetical protein